MRGAPPILQAFAALTLNLSWSSPILAATLPPGFRDVTVAAVSQPTAFVFTPDGRMLVLQKTGAIRVVKNGVLLPAPAAALPVTSNGERGLLGLALDPAFAVNGHVFVYYTTSAASLDAPATPKNRVSRLTMTGDAIALTSEAVILDGIPSDNGNHNGGSIQFGPDGKLYAATGDGGADAGNSQNLATLAGKILRVNSDGTIPPDNPFVAVSTARPEIWCYGLRNPWRFTFDPDGRLFIGDVGGGSFEEVNVGDRGGNFGWPEVEGIPPVPNPAYRDPIYAYPRGGGAAIMAGVFYQGTRYPAQFQGALFFADFVQGFIRTLRYDAATGSAAVASFAAGLATPVHFGIGPEGLLYYASHTQHEIRRLEYVTETLSVVRLGPGTVTSVPAGIQCGLTCAAVFPSGIEVALQPVPPVGHRFAGWSGDPDCSDGVVTMIAARNCIAAFVRESGHVPPVVDVNGDARGDVMRYRPSSGEWRLELSGGDGTFASLTGAPVWAAGWTIRAADFNGDGRTDLLLYNPANGQWVRATHAAGGTFSYFGSWWATGWQPTIVDFDGDGRSDVFLYNTANGRWFVCLTIGDGDFSYRSGQWAPGWQIHPGDFDGNGRGDLFLYNGNAAPDPNRGRWFQVLTEADASFRYYAGDVVWAADWTITTGDFDGDRTTDLFLYRPTGQWFRVHLSSTGGVHIGGVWAPGWTIHPADFDGDGRTDLFLYNASTGWWFVVTEPGAATAGFHRGLWAAAWQVFPTEFNGDGKADLLLYNQTSGQWFQAITSAPGAFGYTTGNWGGGWSITAIAPRLP